MLYTIVFLEESGKEKTEAGIRLINELDLPNFHYPPAVFVSFSGNREELIKTLKGYDEEGSNLLIVPTQRFVIKADPDYHVKFRNWMREFAPSHEPNKLKSL